MGRRKVEMKRIENKSSRQVTFSKRRSGLAKKAEQISVLCDLEVALVIFSSRGKLYEYSFGTTSLDSILDRYRNSEGEKPLLEPRCIDDSQKFCNAYANLQSPLELPGIVERDLQEPKIQDLTVADLLQLERQFNSALSLTRSMKLQLTIENMKTLRKQEKLLLQENQNLKDKIAATKSDVEEAATNLFLGFKQADNNYALIATSML